MAFRTFIILPLLLLTSTSQAGKVSRAHVDYEGGHYLVSVEMKIEARVDAVYAILTDFNHLTALNEVIKVSKLLQSEGKVHVIQLEAEGCVWVFCRRVKQQQRVTELGNGYIQAVTLPDKSDLEYGRVLWHIVQQDGFTLINYHADVVPAFFVPPLLGPYLLKGRMLEEAQKTIEGIERLVRINADR